MSGRCSVCISRVSTRPDKFTVDSAAVNLLNSGLLHVEVVAVEVVAVDVSAIYLPRMVPAFAIGLVLPLTGRHEISCIGSTKNSIYLV